MAETPVDRTPLVLSRPTFSRLDRAARDVEAMVRTRAPRPRNTRSEGLAPGAWGVLAEGETITARSGLRLGEGDVTLYFPDPYDVAELITEGEVVRVYNAGDAIEGGPYGDETVLPLLWINGYWVVDEGDGSGGGGSGTPGRCECPEDSYEVEVECGSCAYGPYVMPRFWDLTIVDSDPYGEGYDYGEGYPYCEDTPCEGLIGVRLRLAYGGASGAYVDDGYGDGCTWTGRDRAHCLTVELRPDDDEEWTITIVDRNDCVVAVLRAAGFDCCGTNANWTADEGSACAISARLTPDPCTCCPDPTCPPPDAGPCEDSECCVDDQNCRIAVTVGSLFSPAGLPCTMFVDCFTSEGEPCEFGDPDCWITPPGQPPEEACAGLNGVYEFAWAAPCTWTFAGVPASGSGGVRVRGRLTLRGQDWTLTLLGPGGQVAVFRATTCGPAVSMELDLDASTCRAASPTPAATFTLAMPN